MLPYQVSLLWVVNPESVNRLSRTPAVSPDIEPRYVVVSGVASGAGKTSLAVAVIEHLRRRLAVGAVKVTVTHGERGCPHGGKSCNVCSSLGGEFQIVSRRDIIEQPETDTARFVSAGASPVLWGITREIAVAEMWSKLVPAFDKLDAVVIESNTLALTIKPTLNLMIVDPSVTRRLWKESAEELISKANLVVINERGSAVQRATILEEVNDLRPSGLTLNIAHPNEFILSGNAVTCLDTIV